MFKKWSHEEYIGQRKYLIFSNSMLLKPGFFLLLDINDYINCWYGHLGTIQGVVSQKMRTLSALCDHLWQRYRNRKASAPGEASVGNRSESSLYEKLQWGSVFSPRAVFTPKALWFVLIGAFLNESSVKKGQSKGKWKNDSNWPLGRIKCIFKILQMM